MKTLFVAVLLASTGASLAAQQDVAARLAGRVPPEVATLVAQLATDAAARRLPIDPLIQKAIEGSAKGVPADRVASAVRAVAAQLDAAVAALQQGGMARPDTESIAAGGFALNAGLSGRDISELARAGGPASSAAVALRVAGTLAALGVPAAETVELVSATLRAGRPLAELLALPARVQAEVARGVTPAQAASGLARAAAGGRGGPPPHRGPPQRP